MVPFFCKNLFSKNAKYVPTREPGQKEAGHEQPKGKDGRVRDAHASSRIRLPLLTTFPTGYL
jgi:hypothetical protein